MEPDLYRALRSKDLRRVRECLGDWGNKDRWIWWSGTGRALTPLHVASKGSSKDILAELLRHPEISCSINESTDKASVTPLHVAAGSSSPEVVRLLLNAGADLASPSGDRSTAFHIACGRGRLDTCAELLRRGSLLEGRDGEERTPLLRAAANGRAGVTKWLLAEGADPAAVDMHGNSALALSCRATSLDPAQALLDGGADVAAENAEGQTCAYLAAVSGRTELLEMMLEAMARSGQRLGDGGGSILYDVVEQGLVKVVQLIASKRGQELGVNVSRKNPLKSGTTALHAAVFRGQHAIVGELLLRGADPNLGNDSGLGALHFACATPDSQPIVRSLLKAKAHANAKDNFDCTPIYYAFVRGNDDLVHYMLSRGASLFKMDYDQALRIACFYGMVQEVESLLWMEAEPNCVALNKRDRGTEFHIKVSPTVRDGIEELLSEAIKEAVATNDKSLRGVGCGGTSRAVIAAKEAAASWGGGYCASPTGTIGQSDVSSFTSADTSTVSPDHWSGVGRGVEGYDSGSSAVTSGDGFDTPKTKKDVLSVSRADDGKASDGRVDADDADTDDSGRSFIKPEDFDLDNDLLRESDLREAAASTGRTAAAVKRWSQRVRGSTTTSSTTTTTSTTFFAPSRGGEGSPGGSSPRRAGAGAGLGVVKDRAKATFAGVIKWATSPPRRTRVVAGC